MKQIGRLLCVALTLAVLFGMLPVHAAQVIVTVTGLELPQAGERIDFSAQSAQSALYTVDEVCWYRAGGETPAQTFDTVCTAGESAAAGRYLCRVYLKLADGVLLSPGQLGFINGQEALVGLWRGRWFIEMTCTARPSTRISAVPLVGIDPPTAGRAVRDYLAIKPETALGCTVTDVSWTMGDQRLGEQMTFRAGDRVSCTVTVCADVGYRFADRPTATLCGQAPIAAIEQLTGQIYRFVFNFTAGGSAGGAIEAITVGSVSLSVPTPTGGMALSAAVPMPSAGVSITRAEWSPADSAFVSGKAYTLTVTLTPNAGYTFSNTARPVVSLNQGRMTIGAIRADSLTASYTFPPIDLPVNPTPPETTTPPGTITKPPQTEPDPGYAFPFTDVPVNAWYRQWVEGAHRMGLINGKTATTYVPDANMTWAEAIKLAACMHQLYSYDRIVLQNGNPWYRTYLDYCREMGIIPAHTTGELPGYAEIEAVIDRPITRVAYVWLFSRALPVTAFPMINAIPDNAIPDVKVAEGVLDDGIYLFYRAGILNGRDANGTFDPAAHITRSEVAAVLMRLMNPANRVGPPANLKP